MKNAIAIAAGALAAGLLFGLGLTVSGMANPAKVLGFLDLFGNWDPSLAFVMAGALSVTAVGYRLVWRSKAPLLAERFHLPARRDIDARLVLGAVVFGVGWGLVGLCPGPALAALTVGGAPALMFLAAMLAGQLAYGLLGQFSAAPGSSSRPESSRSTGE